MTKIISANGKPIESAGKVIKQNYLYGKGFVRDLKLEFDLPNDLPEYTVFAMQFKYIDQATVSNDINMGNSLAAQIRLEDSIGSMVFVTRVPSGLGSFAQRCMLGAPGFDDTSNFLARDFMLQTFNTIESFFLSRKGDNLRYKMLANIPDEGNVVAGSVVSSSNDIRKVIFNNNPTISSYSTNTLINRVLIFNRQLSVAELKHLFNNGNGNEPISKTGLIAECNFNEANIIDGTDVGFIDESGNNVHGRITSGLPAGTLQEQVDFVNQNSLVKWV